MFERLLETVSFEDNRLDGLKIAESGTPLEESRRLVR